MLWQVGKLKLQSSACKVEFSYFHIIHNTHNELRDSSENFWFSFINFHIFHSRATAQRMLSGLLRLSDDFGAFAWSDPVDTTRLSRANAFDEWTGAE